MMPTVRSTWSRGRSLVTYFILAYVFTWIFEIPLAAVAQGWIRARVPFWIHYLGGFGPMLAALTVTGLSQGRDGVARLMRGVTLWRVGWTWTLIAVFLPIGLFAGVACLQKLARGTWPDLALLGEVEYLPYLGIPLAVLLWFLTWGLGEEIGWRGFALPRLQNGRSALAATAILGVIHALWHLPAFFYKDAYRSMGLAAGLPMVVLSVVAAAITFTWIFNSTRGSILLVAVYHALFDWLSVSKAGGPMAPAVMSGVVWVLAVLIVIVYKPANLSRQEKQTA
ncbi:MAG TPA: CPBP family intramembrane glutamic endopeptidase [Anaerolineales bacterium]|nr:CPBP family intramembrane glutamic endopeptidase [Anaerolineales bacterium]